MIINKEKILSLFNTSHRYIFYCLLILLPTQLGLHFWPSWALVLGRRVDYLSPTLFFTDILIISLLLCWVIESVYGNWYLVYKKNKKFVFPQIPDTKSQILIFILFIIANIWFSPSRPVALYSWVKFLEFVLLGWYIVRTKPDLFRISCFLSLSVLYSSVLAMGQFILQHSVGGPLWLLGERTFTAATPGIAQIPLCLPGAVSCPLVLRPYATFPHPNVLGGFLAVILPLIILSFSRTRESIPDQDGNDRPRMQFKTVFFGAAIIVGLLALVLTFSRSAWVAGAVAIAMAITRITNRELRIKNKELRIKKNIFFISALILTSLFFILYILYMQRTGESVVVRVELAVAAMRIWQTAPIVGVGLGNFLVALPQYLPLRTIYFLQPVHNIYLLILSEVGIFGIGAFSFLLFKLVKHELRIVNRESRKIQKKSPFIIRYSLFTILLLGLIDHYPLSLQQGQLLLTLLISLSVI